MTDNAPNERAGSMTATLRRMFALFDTDARPFAASLVHGRPTPRRRAPHRRRRASPHAMRFRKTQVRRALPLLVETPLGWMC